MVANRQEVAVSLNPFADGSGFLTSVALPLWAWFMLMICLGMVLGFMGMWSSSAPNRKRSKEMRQELKTLKRELAIQRETQPDGETLPVLTSE